MFKCPGCGMQFETQKEFLAHLGMNRDCKARAVVLAIGNVEQDQFITLLGAGVRGGFRCAN